jgi:serine phosphatase RsbU (regulator of sigma subunit)
MTPEAAAPASGQESDSRSPNRTVGLLRLVERDALVRLLAAAADLAGEPGGGPILIRVVDPDERTIVDSRSPVGDSHPPDGSPAPSSGAVERESIQVGDLHLGFVEVSSALGPSSRARAVIVARGVELAAAEGLRRRAVGAAAIDDLRELSLLSRLAEMLGGSVDAAGIASCTLATISRPLGPVAGLVIGPDGRTALASCGNAGDVEALAEAAAPMIAALQAESRDDGTCADLEAPSEGPLGSVLVAFLRTARGHQGAIALARRAATPPFTAAHRRLVAAVASQAAVAIERAALQGQIARRQVVDHELEIGRRIQTSLMPRRFPVVPGWELASLYEPAREVGGDFYDAFPIRDQPGRIGLVVADVTGKGIPAAILMADSRALLHAAADHGGDPAETLARVNRILVAERASGLFVTVGHAVLDSASGRMRYASAGHDPIHVLRADGSLEVLDPPGRLLGIVADVDATLIDLELRPGDIWIGHTDGVTEARDAGGGFYGEDRYRDLLARLAGRSAAEIVDTVREDVASFRGAAEPFDDLTLLVLRREPDAGARPAAN